MQTNGPGFEPLHDAVQDIPIRRAGKTNAWCIHKHYSASAEGFIKCFILSRRLIYGNRLDLPKVSFTLHCVPLDKPIDELVGSVWVYLT